MNKRWVVPCFFLVDAKSSDEAESKVEVVRSLNKHVDAEMMFDERLTAWPFDADKHEIHSALDKNRCELRVRYVAQATFDDGPQAVNPTTGPYWVFDTDTNSNVAGPLLTMTLAKKVADLLESERY